MRKNENEIGMAIAYKKLKKIVGSLDKINFRDNDMVSFEYIVGSCFPNVYENIQTKIKQAYTQGYADGLKNRDGGS